MHTEKARTVQANPHLLKTTSALGTGASSPAPMGKYRPGRFKLQVWDHSPCALGVLGQALRGETGGYTLPLRAIAL